MTRSTIRLAGLCCACIVAACVIVRAQAAARSTQAADAERHRVARLFVEPFPAKPGSDKLRAALIDRLRKLRAPTLATDASAADATLHGDGEVWIRGYQSLNPRSGRLPSNGRPIYGGFLSVELTDAGGETLWSYLVSENATEDVFDSLAKNMAKHVGAALQATAESERPVSDLRGRVKLTGAGATFPSPIYAKWLASYARRDPNVAMAYDAVGSEEGVRRLLAGAVDFGACDRPEILRALAADRAGDYVLIPAVVGAVVPIVNLPGLAGEIALTPDALAGIYLGRITKWNDPLLAQANRGLHLPDLPITVVHRAEGSGTSFTWTDYLSKTSRAWQARVGVGLSPAWPVGQAATGNDGVAALVTKTMGAIGYVEYIYAVHTHVSYARVRNRHGAFVAASLDSIAAATMSAAAAGDTSATSIVDAPGADAYPIASLTWLVIPAHVEDPAKRAALTSFLHWMLTAGQRQAAALGYLALPEAIATKAGAAIASIR